MTVEELLCKLKRTYAVNRSVPQHYHITFIVLYSVISVFAFLCNSLLLVSLYHHKKKSRGRRRGCHRNSRNWSQRLHKRRSSADNTRDVLIGCLATFDLLLSITMPLTALDVLSKHWPLGPNTEPIAKLTRAIPAAVVYSSSMTIILIAVNCYRQILHSSEKQLSPKNVRFLMATIVLISAISSTPIYHYTKLTPLVDDKFKSLLESINSTKHNSGPSLQPILSKNSSYASREQDTDLMAKNDNRTLTKICKKHDDVDFNRITFLIDDWPDENSWTGNMRFYYSMFSIFAQLVVPFFVISFCYYSIYKRLQIQGNIQKRVLSTEERIRKETRRKQRRNKLLATISLVYLITWLPLDVFAAISDANVKIFGENLETNAVIFMVCHLIGMSSACANPIIYGFRNKHLRKGNLWVIIEVDFLTISVSRLRHF